MQERLRLGRSNGRDLRFWREAPLIGPTGVAEVEIGERGVIAERVAYDGNLASNTLRRTCTHRSDMNSNFSRIGGVSNNN